MHARLVEDKIIYLLTTNVSTLVVIQIRDYPGLGLFSKRVIDTKSHLFVVLSCTLLTLCFCFLHKVFTSNLGI